MKTYKSVKAGALMPGGLIRGNPMVCVLVAKESLLDIAGWLAGMGLAMVGKIMQGRQYDVEKCFRRLSI